MTIVCTGIATPPQKHHPSFLPSPLPPSLNLQTVKALLFRQSPFVNPTLKLGFFCDPKNIKRLSSFISSYLLKVTKFLVKISQFEFLVMTEKIIFVFRLFEPAERKRGYILRSFIKRGFRITFSFFFYKKIIFFVCASAFLT